jgi:hypothetical protein
MREEFCSFRRGYSLTRRELIIEEGPFFTEEEEQ